MAASADMESLHVRVDRLQLQGGRYHPELSDAKLSLGMAYRAAGEHELAARAFAEALIITRANAGLHDLDQVHYLDLLAEEYVALDRVVDVVAAHRLSYWLHRRAWGDRDARLLPVIDRIVRAHTGMETGAPLIDDGADLMRRLMTDCAKIVDSAFAPDDPERVEALYAQARLHFDLAWATSGAVTDGVQLSQEAYREVRRVVLHAYRSGQYALEQVTEVFARARERDSSTFSEALARTLIHQGDWAILFDDSRSHRYYKQAHEVLSESSDGAARLPEVFGRGPVLPVEIGFSHRQQQPASEPVFDVSRMIEVAFEVDSRGQAKDFKIISTGRGLDDRAELLIDVLSSLRYRPAMGDGMPVSQRITRRFVASEDQDFTVLDRRSELVDSAALMASRNGVELVSGAAR